MGTITSLLIVRREIESR